MKQTPSIGAIALIKKRETLGLRFSLLFGLFSVVAVSFGLFSTAQSEDEVVVTVSLVVGVLAFLVLGLILNLKGIFLKSVGWATVFIYAGINISLIYIWYISVGGQSVPGSFFLKSNIWPISVVTLILVSLPGKPSYPLIYSVTVVTGFSIYFAIGLQDPRTETTQNILESIQTGKVHVELAFNDLAAILLSGILLTFLLGRYKKTAIEASQAEHSQSLLSRYFSPNIVQLLSGNSKNLLSPEGEQKKVAVVFVDVRNFTSISEKLEPKQVFELLRLYHEYMVSSIFKYGGTLDKFIGDGIMATFGTPDLKDDDTKRALESGIEMTVRLGELNSKLESQGLPSIEIGIGIHCGHAMVGNIGTKSRLEYTVIGDTVNTASRIESLCKQTGESLLVSEAVKNELSTDYRFVDKGLVQVKGKSQELRIFALGEKS